MTSLLVTVIFLLTDGAPARHAWVTCSGVAMFEAGNDFEANEAPDGARLLLDSRGAVVLIAPRPTTIDCHAMQDGAAFWGPVKLTKNGQVTKVVLK
jgi:hypothetical protein